MFHCLFWMDVRRREDMIHFLQEYHLSYPPRFLDVFFKKTGQHPAHMLTRYQTWTSKSSTISQDSLWPIWRKSACEWISICSCGSWKSSSGEFRTIATCSRCNTAKLRSTWWSISWWIITWRNWLVKIQRERPVTTLLAYFWLFEDLSLQEFFATNLVEGPANRVTVYARH